MLTDTEIKQFKEEGFVITQGLDFALLDRLRAASQGEAAKVKAANGGKGGGRYIVQLQPGAFADYLASPIVMQAIHDMLGPQVHWGYLHCLLGDWEDNRAMVWHRDGMDKHANREAEMEIINRRQQLVQWNCPLYDGDSCFRFVPGSHRRPISDQELEALRTDPRADMPGQVVAELKLGETVYYNNTMLHQGVYHQGLKRETLHGGCLATDSRWGSYSSGMDKDYMLEPGYLESMPASLRPWLAGTIDFVRQVQAGHIRKGDELGSVAYVGSLVG
ncbi:MAG: hypothetical protein EXR62_06580 [Chloroflexi bacterium]|nr:hypothetical protein [Chloroflexota bacterium]